MVFLELVLVSDLPAANASTRQGPGDGGGGVGDAVGPVRIDQLGGEPAVAVDRGLADHLGDLVHFGFLRGQLRLQVVELGLELLLFRDRRVVERLAFRQPILQRFAHERPPERNGLYTPAGN